MIKNDFKLIPATPSLLLEFIPQIREVDKKEVELVSEESWEDHSVKLFDYLDEAEMIIREEKIIGILGIRSFDLFPEHGFAWLLFTQEVEKCSIPFLRWSKGILKEKLKLFPVLTNVVYKKNKLHVDWLSFMGAVWLPVEGDFTIFQLRRKEVETSV